MKKNILYMAAAAALLFSSCAAELDTDPQGGSLSDEQLEALMKTDPEVVLEPMLSGAIMYLHNGTRIDNTCDTGFMVWNLRMDLQGNDMVLSALTNWFADEFRTAIADGLRAAEETHGSTTTWVMNNHDVPRSPSRFGLPQVKDAPYHQLAHDWLLRDGETYRENRELGTRRARAAALMELGLPGSAYVYQGEELGLFEVANIPWDRLEDPTPFNTRRNFTDKGRDGCRAPMPWKAADCGEPASWSPDFITGGTFGFGPEQGDSADAHLPQPAWFKDFAADVEADDNGSMLHLYRKLLQLRQTVLTATGDTSADLLDMGDTVVAYSRPATEGRRFLSVTNFGDEPIALPDDAVAIANSVPLTDDGKLDSDASVWLLLG